MTTVKSSKLRCERRPTAGESMKSTRKSIENTRHRVRRADKDVAVTVPEEPLSTPSALDVPEARESHKIQALLADVGSRMGMQIWLSLGDKAVVVSEWKGDHSAPLDRLPLNYDDTTLRTIEQIDVLCKGASNSARLRN